MGRKAGVGTFSLPKRMISRIMTLEFTKVEMYKSAKGVARSQTLCAGNLLLRPALKQCNTITDTSAVNLLLRPPLKGISERSGPTTDTCNLLLRPALRKAFYTFYKQ